MRPVLPGFGSDSAGRWLGAACVALFLGAYYWLYFAAPVELGGTDPDRYYHLALSRMFAEGGLLRRLPQAEDLGWASYFPDKEFLFHALTGGAWALGGPRAVLALVPLFGIAIALCLHAQLGRVLRPLPAALLAIAAPLLTVGFLFRITLLRPHLLAILLFCLLLLALLRARPRLAAFACLLFALAYHAFLVVLVVAAAAWVLRRQPGMPRLGWAWCLGGLCAGILLNPYFPSNLQIGVLALRIALDLDSVPSFEQGLEVLPLKPVVLLLAYGSLACTLVFAAAMAWIRKPAPGVERTGLALLFLVTGVFALLGIKSLRALEYAVPASILLMGYSARVLAPRHGVAVLLALMVACQGFLAVQFYRQNWLHPARPAFPEFAGVLPQVPRVPGGHKVFNCEWEAGSYVMYARPDLRVVDMLEPALLWQASPLKYEARRGLRAGAFDDPRAILRGAFKADYVLCASPALIRQMQSRPGDFSPGAEGDGAPVRLFAVRPD